MTKESQRNLFTWCTSMMNGILYSKHRSLDYSLLLIPFNPTHCHLEIGIIKYLPFLWEISWKEKLTMYPGSLIHYSKLVTKVESNLKAPFSKATIPRCRGQCYSFPCIAPLTLDLYLIMLSVKQGAIKYYFLSLWYDDMGLNPSLLGHLPLPNRLIVTSLMAWEFGVHLQVESLQRWKKMPPCLTLA